MSSSNSGNLVKTLILEKNRDGFFDGVGHAKSLASCLASSAVMESWRKELCFFFPLWQPWSEYQIYLHWLELSPSSLHADTSVTNPLLIHFS